MNAPSIRALLEKPRGMSSAPAQPVQEPESNAAEYRPYARGLIGTQPQLTVVFRKANGSVRGFSYSFYYGVESEDPANGFVIDFTHDKVEISGQHLEELFRLVCQHRAAEIVEARRSERFEQESSSPVVERINFLEK